MELRVRPNASTTSVGGAHNGALVVRVTQPAERGRATAAALNALAEALGVPASSVTLVKGAKSRRKVVDVATADDGAVRAQLHQLLQYR